MSQRFETPKERSERRLRNRRRTAPTDAQGVLNPVLSKRAQRRLNFTYTKEGFEIHGKEGREKKVKVTRGRFDSSFYDRSKY